MKKFFFLFVMCLIVLTTQAQRCAVLEFKAGAGISQADVDGIADIFITYFQPAGYTMVERTQIDRVIDEQGFQRSNMTESQMVRIGKILNVSKVVVGRVNVVMRQYNVDVRVINVETGTIAAKEGQQFAATSYRATMKSIAQNLAAKIAIKSGPTVSATSPTDKKKAAAQGPSHKYVDLGLPSGTLWEENFHINTIEGFDYNSDYAVEFITRFIKNRVKGEGKSLDMLPSYEQFSELLHYCTQTWNGNKCTFKGSNGNKLTLDMGSGIDNEHTYSYCTDEINFVYFEGSTLNQYTAYLFPKQKRYGVVICYVK